MIVWTECNKVHEYESMKYKHQLFVAILRVGRDFDFFRQVYNKLKKIAFYQKLLATPITSENQMADPF